jgi:CTP:molybdopterin cytidylyltransferase MocA
MTRAGGIVLAGGRSTRMGSAKAALEWHGSTLLRRVAAIVGRVAGPGYAREEYTHLAVAAAVAAGRADAGLGVRAAAQALGWASWRRPASPAAS